MCYYALATDYDGTLATHGRVDEKTIAALERLLASGRKLLLVTGRRRPDIECVFPQHTLFHRVIAENGALVYDPATGRERLLCEPVPGEFVAVLQEQGIPIAVGRAIVGTTEAHHIKVQELAEQAGLRFEMTLNKGNLMLLPLGVTKATGLNQALKELGLSPRRVIGIGDAENDADLLAACGYGVAVANALPAIKLQAHLVTAGTHGAGVVEVIDAMLANDGDGFTGGSHKAMD
jgi:hydroxymethylpyrimidine pyrophosphatase-like HAD family hydrolase